MRCIYFVEMRIQQINLILFATAVAFVSGGGKAKGVGILSKYHRQPWERKSFEDDSYDATIEEVDYSDWEKGQWTKSNRLKLCLGEFSAEQKQICHCESNGGRSDLLCASQKLTTTDAELPPNFAPSVVHMEQNDIVYLIKDKILPGKEANVLSLDLSSNVISDIEPGTFDKFRRLQVLMLTHNKLDNDQISVDFLTAELGGSLHQLYLDYNFITTLDQGLFDNLQQLKKLVLDGNRGLKLSKGIFTAALGALEVLSLDKCDIKELDVDIFENLTSLRALSLSGNSFDRIPVALSPLHSLTHLAMSSTNIKELKKGDFQKTVPGLERLYMRKMKYLVKVGANTFNGLTNLKFVDFAYSAKLHWLEPNAFGKNAPRNFSELNLQQCNLSTLNAEVLPPVYWQSLEVVKLNGNPFVCDCQLKWLLDMQNSMHPNKAAGPTCKFPPELDGLSLYEANTLSDLCNPTPTPIAKFVVFLVSMILFSSLVAVAVVYARRRYVTKFGGDVHLSRDAFAFPRAHPVGHSSVNGGGIFEEEEGDEAEEGEEQPRGGGHRPEFV